MAQTNFISVSITYDHAVLAFEIELSEYVHALTQACCQGTFLSIICEMVEKLSEWPRGET